MSSRLNIILTPEARAALAKLETAPKTALDNIRATTDLQNQLTIGHITQHRLTGKGPFPPVQNRLGVRSNRLRKSLRATKARIKGTAVISAIGTNVKYAAIHEFGGTTKPHTIKPRRKKALYFAAGGRMVTVGKVNHPGSKIPRRRPIWRGIKDRSRFYAAAISQAITKSLQ